MKTLSLTQPWATLIAIGAKKIETRSWGTNHRGPLVIHASKAFPRDAQDFCAKEPFRTVLQTHFGPDWYPNDLPLGCILAITTLKTCMRMTEHLIAGIESPERDFGNYEVGRYAWFLGEPHVLPEPIPAKGSLGLWEYTFSKGEK